MILDGKVTFYFCFIIFIMKMFKLIYENQNNKH